MKRFMLAALLILIAAVTFGEEQFKFDGQLTYGFTVNPDVTNRSYADAWFIMTSQLTPTAFFTVKMSGISDPSADSLKAQIEDIYGSQKLGPVWIEMGVMGNATAYYDPSDFGFGNLSYDPGDFETVTVRYDGQPFNVKAWFNPTGMGIHGTQRYNVNVTKSLGPLNISAYYASEREGIFGGSVGYTIPIGDFKLLGDAEYKNDVEAGLVRWSLINRLTQKYVEVGADLLGDMDTIIEAAGELTLNLTPWLQSVNGIAYNVPNQNIDCIELGGAAKWEKMKLRFGYFITDNAGNGYSMYVPNPPKDGGAYLKIVMAW